MLQSKVTISVQKVDRKERVEKRGETETPKESGDEGGRGEGGAFVGDLGKNPKEKIVKNDCEIDCAGDWFKRKSKRKVVVLSLIHI